MPNFTLRQTLVADGIASTGFFLLGIFVTSAVATLLGLPETLVLVATWICLPSAILMFLAVGREKPNKALAKNIAIGNCLWVIASLVVLALYAQSMTTLGIVAVAAQALVVLEFAFFEWRGAKTSAQPAAAFS